MQEFFFQLVQTFVLNGTPFGLKKPRRISRNLRRKSNRYEKNRISQTFNLNGGSHGTYFFWMWHLF